ncbi:cell division FtsK/SpoIIIE family protein [Listeria floridensis FSL S10-1187]|uniref:Cell division FtsK/SpoIIIE family protein n=1 Tax=Listeria floridensis FSL S10-1187 TaxID=1265817 RepID=A0ABN0RGV9_9LIST|nr:cell division FtsK/SpoIIIE family protein [Listeria floridensis FSL S10-1187]
MLLFSLKVIFYERYTVLRLRQTLARFIIDRGWYQMETVSKEKENWLSMFQFDNHNTTKTVSKEKNQYFPRVYFQLKNDYLYVRFPLDGMKFQDQFLDVAKTLELSFFSELVKQEMEEGYVCYQFIYAISRDRIMIQDVLSQNGRINLMKRVEWNFDKLPHMLISGGTGAGKSYVILSLILGLIRGESEKEDLKIIDPKNADLADLEGIFPYVSSKKGGILKAIREFKEEMLQRSEDMKQLPTYETGHNYRHFGLRPQFLIFDEFVAFMEMLEYSEQSKVMSDMKQIIMLGRQAGFFIILGLQRPDAKYLADGIRDQFHFRLALGRNSETGYSMMFGDTNKKFMQKEIMGFGYVDAGKGVISEFYSPFVPSDFDFMDEFKKISKE